MRGLLPLLCLLAGPALAQAPAQPTAPPDPCREAADEAALVDCREGVVRRQAAEIAALRRTLEKRASDEPKLQGYLKAAHEAWQRSRDADCRVITYESSSGRGAQAYRLDCVATQNGRRIAHLRELVDNP